MFSIGDYVKFNALGIEDHMLDDNPDFVNSFIIVDFLDSGDDFAYLLESTNDAPNFLTFAANDEQIQYI